MIRATVLWVGILSFFLFTRDMIGDIPMLVNLKSFFLVLLGTLIGGFLSIPVSALRGLQRCVFASFKRQASDPETLIKQIVAIARLHRILDIRELADRYRMLEHPFLRRGLLLLLDQSDRLRIEQTLEKEISFHLAGRQAHLAAVQHFARLAPVFGFVGTLIGLINVLNHMGDATQIGHGMAISLLTTFYGLLLANFLFTPLAGRMAALTQREILILNIVIEGVLDICDHRVSTEIYHRLIAYVETHGEDQAVPSRTAGLWQRWSSALKPGSLAR